jgi:hypothetical protein
MPPADYIANCKWLTEAEVEVYAAEYSRTGFTGALQGYRVRRGSDAKSIAEMQTFSGRTIDVPSQLYEMETAKLDHLRSAADYPPAVTALKCKAGHHVRQSDLTQGGSDCRREAFVIDLHPCFRAAQAS